MLAGDLQKAIAAAAAGDAVPLEKWGVAHGYARQPAEKCLAYVGRVCLAIESAKVAQTKRQSFGWRLSCSSGNESEYRKVFEELAGFLGVTVTDSRKQQSA